MPDWDTVWAGPSRSAVSAALTDQKPGLSECLFACTNVSYFMFWGLPGVCLKYLNVSWCFFGFNALLSRLVLLEKCLEKPTRGEGQ